MNPAGRALRYVVVNEQENFLAATGADCKAEAEIILLSRKRNSRRPEDPVGVVTPAALARMLNTDVDLS